MITKLKTELDRINKGCGKWYPDESLEFPRKEPTLVGSTCGKKDCFGYLHICPTCQKEKETLKKVSIMWADEMYKLLYRLKPKVDTSIERVEMKEIKSLMEKA